MRNTVRLAAATTLLAIPALFAAPRAAMAQDAAVKAKAREVVESSRDAVIHVKVAIKMSMGGQEMDQQLEVLGTIIDASGLTVLSEAGLNPAGMFGGGEESGVKTDVGDVKMVLKDGKEIAGSVVLRDKDLDLAFVAPTDKTAKFPFVSLDAGKAPELLDDVIVVSRLRRSLDRAPSVSIGHVGAIVKKPRTFYVVDGVSAGATGCPAFDAAGKPLGIFLQRRAAVSASGMGGILEMLGGGMLPVVLPCDDVKEGAQQALVEAAKAPPAKAEPPKPAEKKADEPKEAPKGEEPKKDEPKPDEPKKDEK